MRREEQKTKKVSFDYYAVICNFYCRAQKASMIKLDEWKIETFHRHKDAFLKEDQISYRTRDGIMVMAILSKVNYNYLILSDKLISNFNKQSLSEKSIFFDAHKDLLTILVCGYNPDYCTLMQNYHEKKAQSYSKLGQLLETKNVPSSLVLSCAIDLFDF